MKPKLLVIAGPTASGKSALAIDLAEQLDGEIVCVDSLTVYRGFTIGSAKPTKEQQNQIPHHLLDVCEPSDPFTAADFMNMATIVIADIAGRGKVPILAGGAGFYLRALLRGMNKAPGEDAAVREFLWARARQEGAEALLEELRQVDPETALLLHPNNQIRIVRALEVYHTTGRPISSFHAAHGFSDSPYDALQFCLDLPRPVIYQRIEARVDAMYAAGLVSEVELLLKQGVSPVCKPLQAIGYKEVVAHLEGQFGVDEMLRLIKRNTRHFAKRQLTWFRRESEMQWVVYPENSATIHSATATFFAERSK
jgi:tRNA dimethylallyltransferase